MDDFIDCLDDNEIEANKAKEECLFGIDYGTSYTCISRWNGNGRPIEILKFPKFKNKRFPSTISYLPKFNEWVIGDLAEDFAQKYNDTSFINLKKKIGETAIIMKQEGLNLTSGDVLKTFFSISKKLINEMIHPMEIKGTVVAVPYCFYEYQRAILMKIAKTAGIPVLGLINEPEAILLAYCFEDRIEKYEENILIIDLGETHLDIGLFKVREKNKYIIINCLNIIGSIEIGGEYIDKIILKNILEKNSLEKGDIWQEIFEKKQPINGKLKSFLKELKHNLSIKEKEDLLNFHKILGQDITKEVTRIEFEKWIDEVLVALRNNINKVFEEVNLSQECINKVIVNGGSTKIKAIRESIKEYFNKISNKILFLDNDFLVSQGAAIYAAILKGKTSRFGLNPITPYAMGIELAGGIFDDIIIKGKRLPCTDKKIYQIDTPGSTAFCITVYQGNEPTVNKNQLIAPVDMAGLNSMDPEKDYIIIHINLDENGIGDIKVDVENSRISWSGQLST